MLHKRNQVYFRHHFWNEKLFWKKNFICFFTIFLKTFVLYVLVLHLFQKYMFNLFSSAIHLTSSIIVTFWLKIVNYGSTSRFSLLNVPVLCLFESGQNHESEWKKPYQNLVPYCLFLCKLPEMFSLLYYQLQLLWSEEAFLSFQFFQKLLLVLTNSVYLTHDIFCLIFLKFLLTSISICVSNLHKLKTFLLLNLWSYFFPDDEFLEQMNKI